VHNNEVVPLPAPVYLTATPKHEHLNYRPSKCDNNLKKQENEIKLFSVCETYCITSSRATRAPSSLSACNGTASVFL